MQDVHIILGAPQAEKVKPLIQSQGLVIGVDRGAFIAIEEGIKLNVALGDFDSVSRDERVTIEESAEEIYRFPANKEDTDAEIALLYVLEHISAANIYLYNWSGGRMDHLYSLLMLVLQERFLSLVSKLIFIAGNNQIAYYLPGEYQQTQLDEMSYLSFILLTSVEKLTLSGVKYPLKKVDFKMPRALISNEFVNSEATFSFSEGIVAVIQSADAH